MSSNNDAAVLAACPFCGATRPDDPINDGVCLYVQGLTGNCCVRCDMCGVVVEPHEATREQAIAAWNRRATPAGLVTPDMRLVPVEPTEAMWDAAWSASLDYFQGDAITKEGFRLGLRAMLAAAPEPPPSAQDEALRSEVARLREALRPLAAFADWWDRSSLEDDYLLGGCRMGDTSGREIRLTLGDARAARQALATFPAAEDGR